MIECEADVTPHQPWAQDGTADVALKPSCHLLGTRTLPLKHFPPEQEITILKQEYPLGLVVVPTEGYPTESPATLPCKIDSGNVIIFARQDWPDGAVGMFVEI